MRAKRRNGLNIYIEVWLVPLLLALLLYPISLIDFLTFHLLAELFAVIISFIMCALAWTTIKFKRNYLLLFLANGYFWIAIIDLFHVMAWPGMNLAFTGSTNLAVQFWISARFMQAILLLFSVVLFHKVKNLYYIFGICGGLTVILLTTIFQGHFPDGYIDGQGLTAFKIQGEYIIIALLFLTISLLVKNKAMGNEDVKKYMIASIVLLILSEFSFTKYLLFFDFSNWLGHMLKIASFWLLYQGLVATTLISPLVRINSLLEAIKQSPAGMLLLDKTGKKISENPSYTQMLQAESYNVLQNEQVIKIEKAPDLLWLDIPQVMEKVSAGNIWRGKIERKGERSEALVYEATVTPVFNIDNKLDSISIIASDITELLQVNSIITDSDSAIKDILVGSIGAVAELLESRDSYTSGHSKAVAVLSVEIAKELGLLPHEIEGVRIAGLIHDIGKLKVPMEILNKPGRLSDAEFEIIKEHPQTGYSVIKQIPFPWDVPKIVLHHHERWDGQGYPNGLKGEEIPLGARILAVADMINAVSVHRPYRSSLGMEKAFDILHEERGKAYDPEIVDIALKIKDKLIQAG